MHLKDSDGEEIKPSGGGKAFGPMPAFGRSLFGGDDDLNLAGEVYASRDPNPLP